MTPGRAARRAAAAPAGEAGAGFGDDTFRYLSDLAADNRRPWFEANRDRYERAWVAPSVRFIRALAEPLRDVSPYLVADPSLVGGSLFRIYRDTRFSNDKRPYKTHIGIRFTHERAKDVHAPGFYLHLSPDEVWCGCGIWRPAGPALRAVRDAIVEDPDAWVAARDAPRFRRTWTPGGETLVRGPRGYDPAHPLIEDLKRKDFVAFAPWTRQAVGAADLPERFAARCRDAEPFVRFVCEALGLPY